MKMFKSGRCAIIRCRFLTVFVCCSKDGRSCLQRRHELRNDTEDKKRKLCYSQYLSPKVFEVAQTTVGSPRAEYAGGGLGGVGINN